MKTWQTALLCVAAATACLVVQVGFVALGFAVGYFNMKGSGPKPGIVYRYIHRGPSPRPLPSPSSTSSAEAPATGL